MEVTPEPVRESLRNKLLTRHNRSIVIRRAREERGGLMASAPRSDSKSARRAAAAPPGTPVDWPPRCTARFRTVSKSFSSNRTRFRRFTGRAFLSKRQCRHGGARAGPGRHDRHSGTHRHREAHQPRNRRGLEADGLGPSGAGADTSAISFRRAGRLFTICWGLFRELAQHASFPEDEFERERRQLVEELRIERTTPAFLASERLRRVLFGAHPYGTISPTEEQVAYRASNSRSTTSITIAPKRAARDGG